MKDVPGHLKIQEVCEKAVEENPWCLNGVPDHFKKQKMCKKVVEEKPYTLEFFLAHFKTGEMCKTAHGNWKVFLITLRHKRCVIKQ